MKNLLKKSKKTTYPTALFLCFFITHFVFLNSYEIVFGKDCNIGYIKALSQVQIDTIINSLPINDTLDSLIFSMRQKSYRGNFGRLSTLKIPRTGTRLPLTEAIGGSDGWFARSNNAHYLIFNHGSDGNVGDMVIYLQNNWRTISDSSSLHIGDNIFLDTENEWRYMFRISESTSLRFDEGYVFSDSDNPSLIFVITDSINELNHVFEADFISIQNMQK